MIKKLKEIASNAYAPYSNFHVASLFELSDGNFFSGFNVENAAYPNSMCAERVAILCALNHKIDLKEVKKVHIFSPNSVDYLSPCGGCRQTMSEFLNDNIELYLYKNNGEHIVQKLSDLLPLPVLPKNIKGEIK